MVLQFGGEALLNAHVLLTFGLVALAFGVLIVLGIWTVVLVQRLRHVCVPASRAPDSGRTGSSSPGRTTHGGTEMGLKQRAARTPRPAGSRSSPTSRSARRLQCTIQGGDLAPAAARRILDRFAPDLDARGFDDARLLVSELVTNSVRHAHAGSEQAIELTLSCSPLTALRVTIGDHGHGFDAAGSKQPKDGTREGGRGLFLVDAVADRWGVGSHCMTRVWFELAR